MGGDEFQVTRRPGPGRCCPGFIGSIRCSLRSGRNQADDQERQIILTRLAASERPHLGEHSSADFSGGSVIWDSQRAPQTIFAEFLSLRIVGFRKAIGKQRQDVAFLNPDPAFLIGGAGQQPEDRTSALQPVDCPSPAGAVAQEEGRKVAGIDIAERAVGAIEVSQYGKMKS